MFWANPWFLTWCIGAGIVFLGYCGELVYYLVSDNTLVETNIVKWICSAVLRAILWPLWVPIVLLAIIIKIIVIWVN